MPGFVGICSQNLTTSQESIDQAVKETVYSSKTLVKHIHADQHLILKKSYFDFLEVSPMTASRDDVHVWIDGEIYNQPELTTNLNESFASTLLQHYLKDDLNSLLPKVDGLFLALVYDLRKQQLQIITDRYGLKVYYLYAKNNSLIVASELKCFPFFKSFNQQFRSDMIECFVQLEHFMSTATWFEGVELIEPSTVYSYSWKDSRLSKSRYWSWAAIQRSSITLEQASDEIGALLERAIKIRNVGGGDVGVGLSGGFDSRAILVTIREHKPVTYTFGIESSPDVKLAKRVADLAGVRNVYFDMHVDNWLAKRFSGVWKTDGMLNMYHMHYSHLMDEIPKIMDVNLSGFLGDGVLGSTYLTKKGKTFINKRIDHSIAQHYYGKHYIHSNPDDPFFDINKIDVYLIYNRGRRLTGLGMEEANKTIHQRLPFMDIKLLDFSYSLPDDFRDKSRAYHRALLLKYPEFYKNIPHATSGVPIRLTPSAIDKANKLFNRWLWVVKFKLDIATSFTDVSNWVKAPETAKFIRTLLDPKKALYANYTDANFVEMYFEPHLKGKVNYRKQIMGAVTLEVWLQQMMNKQYRNF